MRVTLTEAIEEWTEEQTKWSYLSYVFGLVGTVLSLYGILFVQLYSWGWVATNTSLNIGVPMILLSLFFILFHKLGKERGGK